MIYDICGTTVNILVGSEGANNTDLKLRTMALVLEENWYEGKDESE